jgi:hypothetical protein
MQHDHGVDFRSEEVAFSEGKEYFMGEMKAFSHHENKWTDCHFLRGTRDPSHMHLELLEYNDNGGKIVSTPTVDEEKSQHLSLAHLKDPGLNPTWYQKGKCSHNRRKLG